MLRSCIGHDECSNTHHFWASNNVSFFPCMKLLISSIFLVDIEGGQYLRINALSRRAHVLIVPVGTLSNHLLAAIVSVIGNTLSISASWVTPGVWKRSAISNTLRTCRWASSSFFPVKSLCLSSLINWILISKLTLLSI